MITLESWNQYKQSLLDIIDTIAREFEPITTAGKIWTDVSTGTSSGWHDCAYSPELGLIVAVSAFGPEKVMTSPDGGTWTVRSAPNQDWRNVCWSPELGIFVAVSKSGSSGRVMTSPDGINWTLRSSPLNDFHGVCWSAEVGLFVAVAQSGSGDRVMTSPDGISWTSRSSTSDSVWQTVTWVKDLGLFVSVAEVGTGARCMTSPDGINWTARPCPVQSWKFVTWSERHAKLVAVSYDGNVMTSPDGINWTLGSCPSNAWHYVCYGEGVCVAMGENSGPQVMRSEDLLLWEEMPATSSAWQSCVWLSSRERFVAVGLGGVSMYSDVQALVDEPGGDQDPVDNSGFVLGSSVTTTGSGVAWVNPQSVISSTGIASCQMEGQGNTSSQTIVVSGFGLGISTPSTVEIEVTRKENSGTNPVSVYDSTVSVNGDNQAESTVWGSETTSVVYTFYNVSSDPEVNISTYRTNGSTSEIESVKARVVV